MDLDARGWTAREDLVAAVREGYSWAEPAHVRPVVATDPKGRFEIAGDRIRAAEGHSEDVYLEPTGGPVPDEQYHGAAPGNPASIREAGLRPMDR